MLRQHQLSDGHPLIGDDCAKHSTDQHGYDSYMVWLTSMLSWVSANTVTARFVNQVIIYAKSSTAQSNIRKTALLE
jgi:hypothetical protein